MLVGGGRMQLSPQVAASVSFCFSPEGVPFTIRDVEDAARNIFPGHVGPLEGLTTYSFRRILPTVGHMLQFSSGLGDWLDKDTTKGLHHYSAAKNQQSLRVKHRAYEVASKLAGYEAWEIIPNDALQDADKQAQVRVNKLIQQDQTVIWSILQTRRSSKLNSAFQRS